MYTFQIAFFHLVICIYVSSIYFHGLIALFFLVLNNILFPECTQFIHSPTEGHYDCFQVLAIMNKDAINIHMQVFV